jgi:hypothetical protein
MVSFSEERPVSVDTETRVILFVSGLGTGRSIGNTRLVAQLADSRRIVLPVEHVEATSLPGIDQIIFKANAALSSQTRVLVSVEGGDEAWVALYLR